MQFLPQRRRPCELPAGDRAADRWDEKAGPRAGALSAN